MMRSRQHLLVWRSPARATLADTCNPLRTRAQVAACSKLELLQALKLTSRYTVCECVYMSLRKLHYLYEPDIEPAQGEPEDSVIITLAGLNRCHLEPAAVFVASVTSANRHQHRRGAVG